MPKTSKNKIKIFTNNEDIYSRVKENLVIKMCGIESSKNANNFYFLLKKLSTKNGKASWHLGNSRVKYIINA